MTLPDPPALAPAVKKAIAAGIPVVAFNAGIGKYAESGALSYFGSDESVAGQTGGQRASEDGFKHVLCVVQEQGQVQLEARCAGVTVDLQGQVRQDLRQRSGTCRRSQSTIAAKLKQDPSIDFVVTLGAPIALNAIDADQGRAAARRRSARSTSTRRSRRRSSPVTCQFAIDQQPYLQGYEAVDSLWLYKITATSSAAASRR